MELLVINFQSTLGICYEVCRQPFPDGGDVVPVQFGPISNRAPEQPYLLLVEITDSIDILNLPDGYLLPLSFWKSENLRVRRRLPLFWVEFLQAGTSAVAMQSMHFDRSVCR